MNAVALIPARLASERFPGKVLASETGRPLIQHVAEAAARAESIARVVVAADDQTIADALTPFGTEVVLTGEHPNGTSRLAEAARLLDLPANAVVVNVQGDEPEIEPEVIDAAVDALTGSDCPVATVGSPFAPGDDPADPNIVKVVTRCDGRALLFTRAVVPHARSGEGARPLRHVGIYAYRRAFLDTYVALPATPLELAERLEQLRVLEHGYDIAVALAESRHEGIDTPGQYARFVARWRARAD